MECIDHTKISRGRNRFQAVLVVARIDNPDELDHERVELDSIVPSIRTD